MLQIKVQTVAFFTMAVGAGIWFWLDPEPQQRLVCGMMVIGFLSFGCHSLYKLLKHRKI